MKGPRRQFLQLAASVAASATMAHFCFAQAYPTRPVRLIVGFPPGGASDILARLIGQWLSDRMGQPLIVENKSGASTNLATEAVVRAAPDGHTLLLTSVANAVNASLFETLSFNFMHDIVQVAGLVHGPLVMDVHPSVPAMTVGELLAYAKANPGRINAGSAGNGTPSHLCIELLKLMSGVELVHVPYRGAVPAVTDLLAGQVQVVFDNPPTSLEHIRAGRLRALAVTAASRAELLPEVPVLAESLPGYEVSSWFGIGAPRATSLPIVDRLNREIVAGLADSRIKSRISEMAYAPILMTSDEFGKFIAGETEKWSKVIRAAKIKAG
jgi:tripartite-type tricarboxylate transporter receptor subunit TctC